MHEVFLSMYLSQPALLRNHPTAVINPEKNKRHMSSHVSAISSSNLSLMEASTSNLCLLKNPKMNIVRTKVLILVIMTEMPVMEDINEDNEDGFHNQDAKEVMLTNPWFVDQLDPGNYATMLVG